MVCIVTVCAVCLSVVCLIARRRVWLCVCSCARSSVLLYVCSFVSLNVCRCLMVCLFGWLVGCVFV